MTLRIDLAATGRWFAVARSEEVIALHVVQTQLLGQELAVWRDGTGAVNAWENRCPHRGVRLSIGHNNGIELQCQYHGWRFASGSGLCTYIPAHPTQKPASTIRATTYAVREHHGFVWACVDTPAYPLPEVPAGMLTLRSVVVDAAHDAIAAALLRGYRFAADSALLDAEVTAVEPFVLRTAGIGRRDTTVMFLLQPHTERQTVMHAGVFDAAPPDRMAPPGDIAPTDASPPAAGAPHAGSARLAVLRHHHARMTALRDAIEGLP